MTGCRTALHPVIPSSQDDSIGEAASHGCIRMVERDAAALAQYLQEHAVPIAIGR